MSGKKERKNLGRKGSENKKMFRIGKGKKAAGEVLKDLETLKISDQERSRLLKTEEKEPGSRVYKSRGGKYNISDEEYSWLMKNTFEKKTPERELQDAILEVLRVVGRGQKEQEIQREEDLEE